MTAGRTTRGRDVDPGDDELDEARVLVRAAEVVGDRDPAVAARLAELAADLTTEPHDGDVRLRVLGRVEVVDQATVHPVRGRPAQLLGLLALRGRSTTEVAATRLWPDGHPARARERLRTVLVRTRRLVGPVVVRDGDSLHVQPRVRVDVWEFERLAARALDRPRHDRGTSARAALSLFDHRIAPDLEDQEWARAAVTRLRDVALALHDRLADEAEDADDVAEAAHQLESALALDPTRDHRTLRAARLLAAGGREGRALDLLDRATEQLASADVEPSPELERLTSYLRRRAGRPRGGPRP